MTKTSPSLEQQLSSILSGFGLYARWYGFDDAMDTLGKHTSSTPEEAENEAKQQLLALIKEECRLARLDEISSIELEYAGHIVTTCIHGVAKSISDRYVELSEQKVNK